MAACSTSSISIRSRFVVAGCGEEGSSSSKSANERFGGIERGGLDPIIVMVMIGNAILNLVGRDTIMRRHALLQE